MIDYAQVVCDTLNANQYQGNKLPVQAAPYWRFKAGDTVRRHYPTRIRNRQALDTTDTGTVDSVLPSAVWVRWDDGHRSLVTLGYLERA